MITLAIYTNPPFQLFDSSHRSHQHHIRHLLRWWPFACRPAGAGVAAAAAYPETVASLSVLMFMSEHRVQQLVDKYPAVIEMPLGDVAQRLLLLKRLLPSCDVARMIEREPR